MKWKALLGVAAIAVLGVCLGVPGIAAPAKPADGLPDQIDFDRDIRPIISNNCFACHGPDDAKRKAKLRLDTREGAVGLRKGEAAIVPGDLSKSQLYQRITSTDPDEKMPPADSGKKLTDHQIALLKRWIEQKAPYEVHWAFRPPVRPEVPKVINGGWVRNPIDAFDDR